MMLLNVIFMLTCYPILFLMYFIVRNAGDRNGCCLGTVLNKELREDTDVKGIVADYEKQLKISTIVLALIILPVFFIPWMSVTMTIWMVWILAVCFYPMVLFAKGNKKIRDLKKQRGWEELDDKYWIYGLVYRNENDKRIMVENRMGTGTAVNVATKIGKGSYIFAALMLLLIPLMCIWLIMLEFTPLDTKVVDNTIVCTHLSVEYEIPLEEIEEYSVITDMPDVIKVNGNGMDNICSGTFEIYREGKFEAFYNPQNDLFIKIVTEDEVYYISGTNDEKTQELVDVLDEKIIEFLGK